MKRILFYLLGILMVICVAGYFVMYKPHREISSEKSEYSITVAELKNAFANNDSIANVKYADQTITVSGNVTAIDAKSNTIVVDESLSAVLIPGQQAAIGEKIQIKGRFVGYDDLLEELKMDQVSVNNTKN